MDTSTPTQNLNVTKANIPSCPEANSPLRKITNNRTIGLRLDNLEPQRRKYQAQAQMRYDLARCELTVLVAYVASLQLTNTRMAK